MPLIAHLLLSFVMAFTFVFAIMPVIIRIAHRKNLMAIPDERSSHRESTPSLGGVPIFFGTFFASLLLIPEGEFGTIPFILAGLLIIFMVGLKDDIEALSPRNKTIGLLLGASVIVIMGDVRLASMYELLGFSGSFPYLVSCLVSIFTIYVIINAFNLIDGINGLAGSLGVLISLSFGTWFFLTGQIGLGVLALSLTGALLAFLRFNVSPAQTFMGDCGSLVVGGVTGLLAIEFICHCAEGTAAAGYAFNQPVAVAVGFLIIPLFDTIRVFSTRIIRGLHPLKPDRRHIHHLLLDSGLSHMEATVCLVMVNLFFISMVCALDALLGLHEILLLEIGLALLLTYMLHRYVRARQASLKSQEF